jgi:hypothetical protein
MDNEHTRLLTRFLLLFAALNVLGVVYPPDGLAARILGAGALTALAAGLALLSQGADRK